MNTFSHDAIGGIDIVHDFICRACNNKTGHKWDSALEKELRPWAVLYGLSDKNVAGITESGENVQYHPKPNHFRYDKGSIFDKFDSDGYLNSKEMIDEMKKNKGKTISVSATVYRARDLMDLEQKKKLILQELKHSPPGSNLSFDILEKPSRDELFGIPVPNLLVSPQSKKSALKTCLATLYYASYSLKEVRGIGIDQCDMINNILIDDGNIDLVDMKEISIIKDDSDLTLIDLLIPPPVHWVNWIGDNSGNLLAKISYFDRITMEVRLSATYIGPTFSFLYCIPVKFLDTMFYRYGLEQILEAFGIGISKL
ncbi:MAG: hypothetical protein OXE92_01340 [Bacteroidetes bacterium]|nr:hypothetical protein [Bacteroidota bacterium]